MGENQNSELVAVPSYANWFVSLSEPSLRPDAEHHVQLDRNCPCSPRLFAVNHKSKQNLYIHRVLPAELRGAH